MHETYHIVGAWSNKLKYKVECTSTLELREAVRTYIGLRRSAFCRFKQIGTNSFLVEYKCGWPLIEVFKAQGS